MLLRSHGVQHEVEIVPKRAERRTRSREEATREMRGNKKCAPERLGSALGDIIRFEGFPLGGLVEFVTGLGYLTGLEFQRVWVLK